LLAENRRRCSVGETVNDIPVRMRLSLLGGNIPAEVVGVIGGSAIGCSAGRPATTAWAWVMSFGWPSR
jgi:hypothetical protein